MTVFAANKDIGMASALCNGMNIWAIEHGEFVVYTLVNVETGLKGRWRIRCQTLLVDGGPYGAISWDKGRYCTEAEVYELLKKDNREKLWSHWSKNIGRE